MSYHYPKFERDRTLPVDPKTCLAYTPALGTCGYYGGRPPCMDGYSCSHFIAHKEYEREYS